MAFVDYNPQEVDYSIPYKTFNDLNNGDKIYIIDLENLNAKSYLINKYSKKRYEYSTWQKNKFEVRFYLFINETNEEGYIDINDGNTYLYETQINYRKIFVSTDERICNTIINLLKERNNIQWKSFKNIFGNQNSTYIDPSKIKLR